MLRAILSDVHGNVDALLPVLAHAAHADELASLGDVVGYGAEPGECIELMRERATRSVLGNHDVAAIDGHGLDWFNPVAREAIEWTRAHLSSEHAAWLDGLSYELREPDHLLVHGAPVDYFMYIIDAAGAREAFARTDAHVVFVGHTHVAGVHALEPDGRIAYRSMAHGGEVRLEPERRYIVNVGSVGQPRDGNPDASVVLFDDAARTVRWDRVAYPVEAAQAKILAAGLPAACATRLALGR